MKGDIAISRWLALVLLVVVTGVALSTAIRIEWYNHAVGGFLPRPQPPSIEGNDVKWRTTSPDMAEQTYRRGIAYERGLDISDRSIASIELTDHQLGEVARIRQQSVLHAQFRNVVSTMGLLQYALVPLGILLAVFLVSSTQQVVRVTSIATLVINAILCGLMLYREYYFSLGW